MKKFLMALAVLGLLSAPAFAGPNANGTLILHDTGLLYTSDITTYPSPAPVGDCPEAFDAELPVGAPAEQEGWLWKAYAVFPPSAAPRLKALAMSETFDANVYVNGGGLIDPALDFEVPNLGWPTADGGEAGISFGTLKTDIINEVYWFGGYAYGAPGTFAVGPHSNPLNRFFVDDSVPPLEDAIAGYSSIGFGMAGEIVCPPAGPVEGACCFPDGHCEMLEAGACVEAGGTFFGGDCQTTECPLPPTGACCIGQDCFIYTAAECIALGGEYKGDGVGCDPNPCIIVPVEDTTWGQIKSNYR